MHLNPINRTIAITTICLALSLLFFSCGGSDVTGGDGSADDSSLEFTGTVGDSPVTLTVLSSSLSKTGINGLRLIFSSTADGADLPSIAVDDDEDQLLIRINELFDITLDQAIIIGEDLEASEITINGDRFIATSGNITFSALGNASGDAVTGTFDIGFAAIDVSAAASSATLQGDISATVD